MSAVHCKTHSVNSLNTSFNYFSREQKWFYKKVIHCDSIITRSSGSTGQKRVIYTQPLFIVNATSFPGFHWHKQMPHPPIRVILESQCIALEQKAIFFLDRYIKFCITILLLFVFRKHWLSKKGSPSSRIDKAVFNDDRTIDKPTYESFVIKK